MTNRLLGVLGVLAVIVIVFAVTVAVVAAAQGRGESFDERVASMVGLDSDDSDREHEELMSEDVDDIESDEIVEFLASLIEDDEVSDEELAELSEWLEEETEVFSFRDFDEESEDWDWMKDDEDEWFELELEEWLDEMMESWGEDEPRFWMERRFEFDGDHDEDRMKGERSAEFPRGGWFGTDGDDLSEWLDKMVEQGLFSEDDVAEFEDWLEGSDEKWEWDGDWRGIPGERKFEFDTDDGSFWFRGELRYSTPLVPWRMALQHP